MDAVDEFVLLVRCKSMTDDGHLALSRQLQSASHIGSAHCVIATLPQDECPGLLKAFVSRYQQNRLVHEQRGKTVFGIPGSGERLLGIKSAFSAAVRAAFVIRDGLDRRSKWRLCRGWRPLELSD